MEVGRSTQGIISRDRFLMSEFLEHSFQEIFDLTDQSTAERIKECAGLQELRETLASKGIVLHMDETLWSRRICLDQSKITQILRNLLNNALKYKRERVEISIADRGDALRMAVKDDGQGIPASYHQQIFECYFQMETGREHCVRGHGLGLAGVSVLVEDLKGELALESDEGCGATFLVTVPYAL
jgi:signal transduction histidine kinase